MTATYTGRARNLLSLARVAEFKGWLERRGWRAEPIVGRDEHLRMRDADGRLLLVTGRERASRHATVAGLALDLAQEFLAERKKGRTA